MSDKSLTWFGVFINRPLQFGGVKGRLVVVDVSRQHLHRSVTKLPWLGGLVLGHHRELVVGSAVGCVTVQGFDDKELACDWVDVEVLVGRLRAVALQGVADVVAAVCVTVRGLHLMHRATDAMSKKGLHSLFHVYGTLSIPWKQTLFYNNYKSSTSQFYNVYQAREWRVSVPLPSQRMSCVYAFTKRENITCLYQAREYRVFTELKNVMQVSLPSQRMLCVFTKPKNVMWVSLPSQKMSCVFTKPQNVMRVCLYQARECHVSVPLPSLRMSSECTFTKPENVMWTHFYQARALCTTQHSVRIYIPKDKKTNNLTCSKQQAWMGEDTQVHLPYIDK